MLIVIFRVLLWFAGLGLLISPLLLGAAVVGPVGGVLLPAVGLLLTFVATGVDWSGLQ